MHIPFYGTDQGHRALRDLATRNAAELSEAEPPGLHVEDAPRLLVSVTGERRRVEGLAGPGDAVFEGGVEPDGVRLAPSWRQEPRARGRQPRKDAHACEEAHAKRHGSIGSGEGM